MTEEFIFEQTGIRLTEQMKAQLKTYCAFLLSENEKYNLTAITSPDEVYEKHFADCILGATFVPQGASLCDIGSGAGFPSLPIRIARPDISVALVDSLEKRINFTRTLCQMLNISADFFHTRAEDFAKNHSEQFDVATARAVAPLPILLEYTAQIVKVGGIVLAYKTDPAEAETAKSACRILGLRHKQSKTFFLPNGGKRCLLIYEKMTHTPARYPRGQNKPRKTPL